MISRLKRYSIPLIISMIGLAIAAPWFLPSYPLFVFTLGIVNVIAVLGVNVTMGYAGQISLGHAGFAAIGAYTTGLLMLHFDCPFWVALPAGGLVAALFGYLLGLPALRLGPLYVSMVTFGFGLVVVLILQNWYELANGPNGIAVAPAQLFGNDLSQAQFHTFVVLVAVALFVLTYNIINSRVGRSIIALRESEVAARAMGINIAATKTMSFGLGAGYAGLAGGLFAGLTQFINPDAFVFAMSITFVTMSILGGSGYLLGPVVGGLTLTVLPELLRGAAEYKEFLNGLILLLLLIFLPRGLIGLLSDRFSPRQSPKSVAAAAPVTAERLSTDEFNSKSSDRSDRNVLLRVDNVSVSFGGLAALKNISFEAYEGEILSIIGPNGAGKTTLFNTVSGLYAPTEGRIFFRDAPIAGISVHQRARLGISRTFQNLELFPEMTVLENVLVGAHSQGENGLVQSAFRLPGERRREADMHTEAHKLLKFVGLAEYESERAGNLPFGHQRLLEIARALASKPRLLMLDEPAAGLNSNELKSLTKIIRQIRTNFGITVLLIAHTMQLVMSQSDRVIVLHHGEKIADGSPESVQKHRGVIEAYLGEAVDA